MPRKLDYTETILIDDADVEVGVVYLNIGFPNNLTGTIPPEFGYIEDMTAVTLQSQEGLSGSIPSTIGNMVNLKSFSLLFMGPKFGGVIPSSLFTIPAIEWITIGQNEGDWEFPTSIESGHQGNSVLGLHIKSTGIFGTIPPFISAFTNIKELDLSSNSLEGIVPDSFGSLTSLEYFDLHDNNLNGTLPQSLGQLASMTSMSFGENNFQGPLPSWLGNLSKLRVLDLSYNKFEGPIPSGLSLLSSLEHISLQHNEALNGSISALEPLKNLSTLLLSSNSFSSTIPVGLFSNFTGRVFADFGHNNFTGGLPKALLQHSLTASNYLAISGNNFDDDAVDDVICEEALTLHVDCSSCSCCEYCCSEESTDDKNPFCNFNLDFYKLVGLECGAWWYACQESNYDIQPQN